MSAVTVPSHHRPSGLPSSWSRLLTSSFLGSRFLFNKASRPMRIIAEQLRESFNIDARLNFQAVEG